MNWILYERDDDFRLWNGFISIGVSNTSNRIAIPETINHSEEDEEELKRGLEARVRTLSLGEPKLQYRIVAKSHEK